MKTLYLVRGLSGSGKTELADMLASGEGISHGMYDFFYGEDGSFSFELEKLKEAYRWCEGEVEKSLSEGRGIVVVHNNFIQAWEAEGYFRMGKEHGYDVVVVSLYDGGLNDRELSERCEHGVPVHTIQRQRQRWDLNIYPHRVRREPPPPPPRYDYRYERRYEERRYDGRGYYRR